MTAASDILKLKTYKKLPGHVREILNYVRSLNVDDIRLEKNCHYKITWLVNGQRCGVSFSGTPKDSAWMLKIVMRDIRREMNRRAL